MATKNQAVLEIAALQDVFGIATTGFNEFKKTAGKNVAEGNSSTAASSGNSSKAASSGNYSTAASSGYSSTAASSGNSSTAASSGDYSKAASSGNYSACAAVGIRAAVKGDKGNLIMASEYALVDNKYIPIGGKADIVDGKNIKAGCWYIVEGGEWVEVDFSDGVFSRVISTRNGVKKVKTESGEMLYLVFDENGNSAHGNTIKEARADLVYKAIAKFDGALPKKATGKEWIGIYRAVTGACAAGVRMFVEETGKDLDATYTAKQISKLIAGRYGADAFMRKLAESEAA